MAKKKSTLINMLVALFVITAVAGGVLGLVYSLTKETIANAEIEKNNKAIDTVLQLKDVSYEPDVLLSITEQNDTLRFPCHIARDNNDGSFKGVAIKTSEGGFGGKIELMVGILADGTIKGVSVLSHTETPGLGANMEKVLVGQFADKKPGNEFIFEVTKKKEKGKVDAITAATITSKAFTKAVEKAYSAFEANQDLLNNAAPIEEDIPDAEETIETENDETNETEEGGTENE